MIAPLTVVCENVGADWLSFVPFVRTKASGAKHGGKVSLEAVFIRRQAAAAQIAEVA